jgi:hypothetical protein
MKGDFADTTLLFTFEVRCYILCKPRRADHACAMIGVLQTFPINDDDPMVLRHFIYRED